MILFIMKHICKFILMLMSFKLIFRHLPLQEMPELNFTFNLTLFIGFIATKEQFSTLFYYYSPEPQTTTARVVL